MNKLVLNTENQEFINKNLNSEITSLLLKSTSGLSVDKKLLIEQIEAKKKCKKKLETWFNTSQIYYPNKLNIEQTSSEITAKYKTKLVTGDSLIDLTGGFGVDSYYFSKRFKKVTHCEINENLSNIVKHNYKQLGVSNIECVDESGIEVLKQRSQQFDCIYIDPSRRSEVKGKVFMLKDCLPSIPEHIDTLFKYSKTLLIKTSPLLDLSLGKNELKHVKTIHAVAVNNEVKELLWELESGYSEKISVKTINILKTTNQVFNFQLNQEASSLVTYSKPLSYLYEPNSAILKSGAFNSISEKLKVFKLNKHSHLYTSKALISDFPGRIFKIETVVDYNKKHFKREFKENTANVTVRNFPETVSQIRKKLSLKDGGNNYLFFTTSLNDKRIIIWGKKV